MKIFWIERILIWIPPDHPRFVLRLKRLWGILKSKRSALHLSSLKKKVYESEPWCLEVIHYRISFHFTHRWRWRRLQKRRCPSQTGTTAWTAVWKPHRWTGRWTAPAGCSPWLCLHKHIFSGSCYSPDNSTHFLLCWLLGEIITS